MNFKGSNIPLNNCPLLKQFFWELFRQKLDKLILSFESPYVAFNSGCYQKL